MRLRLLPVLLLLVTPLAAAQDGPAADGFGQGGLAFRSFDVPGAEDAPEPTIGIPWDTDSVFYHSGFQTYRARFAEGEPTWQDVTPPYQVPINLDPMLHADPDTGRIWAGGLHGPCSVMMMSDDDGATWTPAGNMCSGTDFDHQSIGSGPHGLPAENPLHAHAAYYCAQAGTISCAASPDGGQAWLPFRTASGPCGGFHGHIRTSPVTGFVAVPVAACGGDVGFLASADFGLTWASRTIPGTDEWTNGFDPSLQFTRGSGWLYYGMASEDGVHVALSKDEGATWEPLGQGHGRSDAWLDVGSLHDPPVVSGVFSSLQAGDDERAALTFIGLEAGPGADADFLRSTGIYRCDERQAELVWRYYVALTYDAGATWTVQRISDDPVQVGGIWDVVIGGDGSCRNLLDFNDLDIDSQGRLHVAWADGCVRACEEQPEPGTDGWRSRVGKLFRQTGGRGLFAAADLPEAPASTTPAPTTEPTQDSPAPAAGLAVAALAAAVAVARRRRA